MIKIFNAKQIYQLQKATIDKHQFTSMDLAEITGNACFNWIHNRLQGNKLPIHVFCGIGNNGGDGLVLARILIDNGYNAIPYVVNYNKNRSDNFLKNYDKLKEMGLWPKLISSKDDLESINENDMVIDAILGIGLTKEPNQLLSDTIQHVNASNAYTLSLDVPSGLFTDHASKDYHSIVKAFQCLTFQNPKLCFLLPENEAFCANWEVIDISLDQENIYQLPTNHYIYTKESLRTFYTFRSKFSHKGNFGHSLLIGGSHGKIGAVTLASKAALKIGSGLVTSYIPKCGYPIIQSSVPEVMVEIDDDNELNYFNSKTKATTIGIGMGMGTSAKTQKGFEKFLKENKTTLVLDADAINCIAKNKKLIQYVPENSIITPHPKELERLIGKWKNDYDKLEKAKKFASKNKITLIIKGHYTAIINKETTYFNTTGNPALATGGTGDVLTGMITGLLAQGYTSLQASLLGVYLHGLTADIAMSNMVYETFTASDIINNLSVAFIELFTNEPPEENVENK